MKLKITNKMISIPPYLSAHWSQIAAIHMKERILMISLKEGQEISIPDLAENDIEEIFNYHAQYLESKDEHLENISKIILQKENTIDTFMENMNQEMPIKFAFGSSMDNLETILQHNPNQSDAPDLPREVLQKIGMISKIISPENDLLVPNAEEGCNCFYCQICRAFNSFEKSEEELEEIELISDKDLEFQQWEIKESGKQQFSVTNRLDHHEKYNVYLGEPVGCTCGKPGCEHILAVLKS